MIPARRVQQCEIAERAGVSISTVSRVLNNVAGISSDVNQRVRAAAAELGYPFEDEGSSERMQHIACLAPFNHG